MILLQFYAFIHASHFTVVYSYGRHKVIPMCLVTAIAAVST